MGFFKQALSQDGSRCYEFFFRDGKYWKQDSWSQDCWELDQGLFERLTENLQFFQRGTHIHTIHGEIMEKVFVLIIK